MKTLTAIAILTGAILLFVLVLSANSPAYLATMAFIEGVAAVFGIAVGIIMERTKEK